MIPVAAGWPPLMLKSRIPAREEHSPAPLVRLLPRLKRRRFNGLKLLNRAYATNSNSTDEFPLRNFHHRFNNLRKSWRLGAGVSLST